MRVTSSSALGRAVVANTNMRIGVHRGWGFAGRESGWDNEGASLLARAKSNGAGSYLATREKVQKLESLRSRVARM